MVRRARWILLLAPIIFVAHFLEESNGFVPWFNAHVARGISEPMFWSVNFTALAITVAVVAIEWFSESPPSALLVGMWLGFLMLANALFHIAGALHDGAYMPGLITAVLLYLPFCGAVAWQLGAERRVSPVALATAAAIGALPMLMHGYLIVFRHSRLF